MNRGPHRAAGHARRDLHAGRRAPPFQSAAFIGRTNWFPRPAFFRRTERRLSPPDHRTPETAIVDPRSRPRRARTDGASCVRPERMTAGPDRARSPIGPATICSPEPSSTVVNMGAEIPLYRRRASRVRIMVESSRKSLRAKRPPRATKACVIFRAEDGVVLAAR